MAAIGGRGSLLSPGLVVFLVALAFPGVLPLSAGPLAAGLTLSLSAGLTGVLVLSRSLSPALALVLLLSEVAAVAAAAAAAALEADLVVTLGL